MDGNPGMAERAAWIKWAMRGAAAASVPFTMWFPQVRVTEPKKERERESPLTQFLFFFFFC